MPCGNEGLKDDRPLNLLYYCTIKDTGMLRQFGYGLLVLFVAAPVFACSGLDYCPMPVHKANTSWTFFQSLQNVSYDSGDGTQSYWQWTPRLEYAVSDTWRVGGHVPFVALNDPAESGFGNLVLFTDFAFVNEKNNRWIGGVQVESVTGRTDHGISASSPQILPYVTWLPVTGTLEWVATLGYRHGFGSHETKTETSTVASVGHAGHAHVVETKTTYAVSPHAEKEALTRFGVRFPVLDKVFLGVYGDTAYILDSDVDNRFLATLTTQVSTTVWNALDVSLGGTLPVTDQKRDLGSLYATMRVSF